MSKYDEHYRALKIQPIDVMEDRVRQGNPLDPEVAFNLALALKYIMRAGWKTGQSWQKDVTKAMNCLHRALHGEWLPSKEE